MMQKLMVMVMFGAGLSAIGQDTLTTVKGISYFGEIQEDVGGYLLFQEQNTTEARHVNKAIIAKIGLHAESSIGASLSRAEKPANSKVKLSPGERYSIYQGTGEILHHMKIIALSEDELILGHGEAADSVSMALASISGIRDEYFREETHIRTKAYAKTGGLGCAGVAGLFGFLLWQDDGEFTAISPGTVITFALAGGATGVLLGFIIGTGSGEFKYNYQNNRFMNIEALSNQEKRILIQKHFLGSP